MSSARLTLRAPTLESWLWEAACVVRGGYACADPFPPDVGFAALFSQLEKEAQAARRGLWGACPTPQGGNHAPLPP